MTRQDQACQADTARLRPEHDMHSQSDVVRLRKELNELRGYVAQIAINAHRMGLQSELLLSLSRGEAQTSETLNSDQLVLQYLSGIGLLAKLDTNVRGLGR